MRHRSSSPPEWASIVLAAMVGGCSGPPTTNRALLLPYLTPRLLNPARLVLKDGRPEPVFDAQHLPVVQVATADSAPVRLRWASGETSTAPAIRRGPVLLLAMNQPPPHGRAVLRLELGDAVLTSWHLPFTATPDDDARIVRARRLARLGDITSATGALAPTMTDPLLAQYFLHKERGSLLRIHQDLRGAAAAWERARQLAVELGSPTEEASRLRALAYLDLQTDQYSRAMARLRAARTLAEGVADEEGLARSLYYEGLLLQRRGAAHLPQQARARYRAAFESAWRRGADAEAGMFAMQLAALLAEHGSYDAANELFEQHCGPEGLAPDQVVDVLLHRAYADRLALEAGVPGLTLGDVRARLDAAMVSARGAGQPRQILWATADRFLLEADVGDPARADALRPIVEAATPDALEVRRWPVALATVHLDLRAGRLDGLLARLDELRGAIQHSEAGTDRDFEVIALGLRGEILHRQGDTAGAKSAFEGALLVADELARRFAQPRAQGPYRARRRAAVESLLSILLEAGAVEEALQLHERRRALALTELAAQANSGARPNLRGESVGVARALPRGLRGRRGRRRVCAASRGDGPGPRRPVGQHGGSGAPDDDLHDRDPSATGGHRARERRQDPRGMGGLRGHVDRRPSARGPARSAGRPPR